MPVGELDRRVSAAEYVLWQGYAATVTGFKADALQDGKEWIEDAW